MNARSHLDATSFQDSIQRDLNSAMKHQMAGRFLPAAQIYQQILRSHPDHPVALNRLGIVSFQSGDSDQALNLIEKAIFIAPDYAKAHENLGLVHQRLGNLFDAETCFRHSLSLQPDDAEAHNKVGFVLQALGKPEEAQVSFRAAVELDPNNFIAHYNLGNALHSLGLHDDAVSNYEQVLHINPGFAAAHFSLHALRLDQADMSVSINCLKRAVECEPTSLHYQFMLGMLLEYSSRSDGAKIYFDAVEQGPDLVRANLDAWRYLKSANETLPTMTGSAVQAFQIGIEAANKEGLVLEFGVRFGRSIRQIAGLVQQDVHGFDSFEGIPESWNNEPGGAYTTGGVIPSVPDNVTLYKGWFEDTLPEFVVDHPEPVRMVNIDCDIYSSTVTVLSLLSQQIVPGTVIVFDEYIGCETWRNDEFKAFQEMVLEHGWRYEYLCFSFLTRQVAVRIL